MELQRYMRWVLVSITSTEEHGQHMSNLQAWLLGLNLLISYMCQASQVPNTYGLEVALGTHTI
jgi:hypothetical protein